MVRFDEAEAAAQEFTTRCVVRARRVGQQMQDHGKLLGMPPEAIISLASAALITEAMGMVATHLDRRPPSADEVQRMVEALTSMVAMTPDKG